LTRSIKPYFELLVIVAEARDRIAVVNASDAQVELLGFGFLGVVGEGLDEFGLA